MDAPPERWPTPTVPEVWITYRTNPAISNWDTGRVERMLERFPFIAAFAYTQDETNWYADLLLPEATDLESLQLYRVGGTKYIEQYWRHTGWAIRQPVVAPPNDTRDLTDVATELAARVGLLDRYLEAINRGAGTTVPLKGADWDVSFPAATSAPPTSEHIWDRVCRAATRSLTGGAVEHDLAWFRHHGAFFVPFPETRYYLHTAMVARGLRYELPYQERIKRVGAELGARLREGVRPDVAVALQQFGHWATPFARELGMPSLNEVASMDLALTDATGSGADLVPVAIRRM
jgi:phenylacetyl-CoA:acceptor oxidoreductase